MAAALEVEVLGAEDERLSNRPTGNPAAYRHYLVARAHVSGMFSPRDWRFVKRSHEAAFALDPEFADAHAGLALYYYHSERWDSEDAVRRGIAAADRAIALDPESSYALIARADYVLWRYRHQGDYDAYARAQGDFQRAEELAPSSALAYFNHGLAKTWPEPDHARELFERAAELDPLRHGAVGNRALLLSRHGKWEVGAQLNASTPAI